MHLVLLFHCYYLYLISRGVRVGKVVGAYLAVVARAGVAVAGAAVAVARRHGCGGIGMNWLVRNNESSRVVWYLREWLSDSSKVLRQGRT
ncbi:hypothetical protein BDV34DRAFT_187328 [Aspergillus parasiticus]|uniref:Uncharacterized protein n=1 Tax=Aspergillus parasiticus TaxID=5067 RepID=A0A5N6DZ99_ASPPA|nr:hypothetical protein BDV34DRAFT_187328 [Aspergillus parasiticus]